MSSNYQLVISNVNLDDEALAGETWTKDEALRMIVAGFSGKPSLTGDGLKIVDYCKANGIDVVDVVWLKVNANLKRANNLAMRSIKSGLLKEIDLRDSWLDWAARSNYSIAHLRFKSEPQAIALASFGLNNDESCASNAVPVKAKMDDYASWPDGNQLTSKQVMEWLGWNAQKLGRQIKDSGSGFPRGVKRGRYNYWSVGEIKKYLNSRSK